ncbi:MAG: class I SAM-dependent methyltransferase [Candidatus Omnitrophica bacterium]|nr:class I SAM-dependent methyltransferase [Candidatus Omnitrophota bacterium]
MLNALYCFLHRLFSKPGERGKYSSGYWQGLIRRHALSLCQGIPDAKRILEVGCGEGLFLRALAKMLPQVQLWGIDQDCVRLNELQKEIESTGSRTITIASCDAKKIEYPDAYFDAVVCINVFFNMATVGEVLATLSEMKRVCKPGGVLIFDFRNAANPLLAIKYRLAPYYDATVKNLPLKIYTLKEITEALQGLGLHIVKKQPLGSFIAYYAPIIMMKVEKNVL